MPVNTARFLIDVKKHWGALEEESWLIYSSRGWYPPQLQAAEEPHTVDAEADSRLLRLCEIMARTHKRLTS